MALIDVLFPQIAQAENLRRIADASEDIRRSQRREDGVHRESDARIAALERRLARLEEDKALLAALTMLLLKAHIGERGLTPEQLRDELAAIDRSDGVEDGGLDIGELRALLGQKRPSPAAYTAPGTCPDCGRVMSLALKRCLYCGAVEAR